MVSGSQRSALASSAHARTADRGTVDHHIGRVLRIKRGAARGGIGEVDAERGVAVLDGEDARLVFGAAIAEHGRHAMAHDSFTWRSTPALAADVLGLDRTAGGGTSIVEDPGISLPVTSAAAPARGGTM